MNALIRWCAATVLIAAAATPVRTYAQAEDAATKLAKALQRVADYDQTGSPAEASALLKKILDKYPDHVAALCLQAKLKLKEKDLEGAEEAAALAFGLAGGQDPEARKVLDQVRTYDPSPTAVALGTRGDVSATVYRRPSGGYRSSSSGAQTADVMTVREHADGSATVDFQDADGSTMTMHADVDGRATYEGRLGNGFTFRGEGRLPVR